MTEEYAPIAVFAFNRPNHLKQTLTALALNKIAKKSSLHVFIDGPRTSSIEKDTKLINECISTVGSCSGFKEVIKTESPYNNGLAKSIINGVSSIINKYGKVIVLEDDMLTTPSFLEFMNNCLSTYANDNKIMHITGFQNPQLNLDEFPDIFLTRVMNCWGWATWQRAWNKFDWNLEPYWKKIKQIGFDTYDPFFYDAENQLKGNLFTEKKTWAVRWHNSIYFNNGYSIFPRTSLIKNIGNDGSGENCANNDLYTKHLLKEGFLPKTYPNLKYSKDLNDKIRSLILNEISKKSIPQNTSKENKRSITARLYYFFRKVAYRIFKNFR